MTRIMTRALAKIAKLGALPKISPEDLKQKFELKHLKDKHKTIVALHLQGLPRIDIAAVAGCTPEYVSMVVAQPLAKEYMKQLEEYTDSHMKAAYGRAVDVIHDVLDSEDDDVRLKAARLALEANGKLKGTGEKSQSAEDVVAQILARAQNIVVAQNVQINQSGGDQ